jgi:choline-glycine betaine transporter
VYGFVAATAFLVPVTLSRRDGARLALYPALALLAASFAAFMLLGVVRGLETGIGDAPLVLAEAVLAVIFVAGLEGVFYNMMPFTFMDGRAVFDWSRVAWAIVFGVVTFLFWQLLINPDAGYLDALRQTRVVLVLVLVAFYVVVTAGTWSYFRWRTGRLPPAGTPEEPATVEP